jgi:hypothetical protein
MQWIDSSIVYLVILFLQYRKEQYTLLFWLVLSKFLKDFIMTEFSSEWNKIWITEHAFLFMDRLKTNIVKNTVTDV